MGESMNDAVLSSAAAAAAMQCNAMQAPLGVGAVAAAGGPAKDTMMQKTKLCQKFMQTGACSYGDKCTFAHG